MEQIIEVCQNEGIHMISTFYLKHSENEEDRLFSSTHIPGQKIADKIIDAYHVLHCGYEVQKPFMAATTITSK